MCEGQRQSQVVNSREQERELGRTLSPAPLSFLQVEKAVE